MFKRLQYALILALLLAAFAGPTMAAQSGGGVHFGAYKLAEGERFNGDLVVFGPVELEADSEFRGDLVAFGDIVIAPGAEVTGELAAFGAADVAGIVGGDFFGAGAVELRESAVIRGNMTTFGDVVMEEGATVEGEVLSGGGDGVGFTFDWEVPNVPRPLPVPQPSSGIARLLRPSVRFLRNLFQGLGVVIILGLFALLMASVWPKELSRVGRAMVEVPLPAFGVGALSLLIAFVVIVILVVTICFSLLAPLVGVVVGIGVAMGWVALGSIVGERLLRGLFKQPQVTPVMAALVGTTVITLLAALVNVISGCLYVILVFPLFALAAGAVMLTRFGTMPYATQGGSFHRPPPSEPVPPTPPYRPPPAPPSPFYIPPQAEDSDPAADPFEDDEEIPSPYDDELL